MYLLLQQLEFHAVAISSHLLKLTKTAILKLSYKIN